jgi:hypothetical protein
MNCKVCNTRMSPGERTCPNCGNDAGPGASARRQSKPGPLPSAEASNASDPDEDIELELDEVTGEQPAEPPPPKAKPKAKPASKAKPAARRSAPSGAAPLFSPDPAGLRVLLAERPESLEPGLQVFKDDKGAQVGGGYSSPVGQIDLIANDADGDLVVVSVVEKSQGDELVADLLKRLGWVRKHLAEPDGKRVRGIVLCEEPPEDLSYTAAAVADTVCFKTYRVTLSFDDVEV